MWKEFPGPLLLICAASSASAQTTNCRWVGSTWTCDTQQRQGIDTDACQRAYCQSYDAATQPLREYQAAQQLRQQQELQQQQTQIQRDLMEPRQREAMRGQEAQSRVAAQEHEQLSLRQRAGKIVSAGDRPGALAIALEGGDFELANSIRAFCQK